MKNPSFYENLTQFVENLIFPALDWPSSALLDNIFYKNTKKTKPERAI